MISAENRTNLIVLQSTSFCNIDCRYCYLPNRSSKASMRLANLRSIAPKLFEFPTVKEEVTVLWHAGEPLVLPPEYYEEAAQILYECKPKDLNLKLAVVTNGTRINESWADLFKKHKFKVGVSVDGPQFIHDAQRISRSGKGTFSETLRGIDCLRSNHVNFYTISVLTSLSLDYPDEMYHFFASNGIKHVCFNIEEIEGPHAASSLTKPHVDRFRKFLSRFIYLASNSDMIESVRELNSALARLQPLPAGFENANFVLNDQVQPFGMINVDTDGNVSTFSPELLTAKTESGEGFVLGNLMTDSVDQILQSPRLSVLTAEIEEGVAHCRETCGYFSVCGGGSPSNKFFETGSLKAAETMFCQFTQKAVFDVVFDLIRTFEPDAPRAISS